ncbi:MAG: porin family protein [Bacteroidales bacterium]|nr:porin family protein [Bacteroidales bacterium]
MVDYDNNFDQMIKSILEEGQEEVPAGIWEGVSSGIDKIELRKKVLVIFRRAAIGAAVAASLILGFIFGNVDNQIITEDKDMIAMAEVPEVKLCEPMSATTTFSTATAATTFKAATTSTATTTVTTREANAESPAISTPTDYISTTENSDQIEQKPDSEAIAQPSKADEASDANRSDRIFWEQDELKDTKKIKAAIEISGLAGTNSTNQKRGFGLMKRPSLPSADVSTGITENSTGSTFGIPVSFGLGVRFDLTPRWSVSTGVRYSLLERKFYGTYTRVDEEGNIVKSESSDIRNSQHYFGIPVNVAFNIINKDYLRFYAYAGGAVEKCLADKYNVLSSNTIHIEGVKGAQLSVNVGAGVEFLAGKHLGIYLDPSLRYYFKNGQPTSIRTVRPLMLGFEAGLRFRL